MATSVLAPVALDTQSARVLAAYETAQQRAAESAVPLKANDARIDSSSDAQEASDDDSAPGWVQRLSTIEGVPPERLAPLHGRLIAQGLLRFQLLDHTGGVVYRLTPEGRSILAVARGEPARNLDQESGGPTPQVVAHTEIAA